MRVTSRVAVAALCLGVLSSCATLLNNKKKSIFLHMSEDAARSTTFYLDGKQADWHMKLYSSREVSRTSTTVTYQDTYVPALTVPGDGRYVTLAAERDGQREEILLKRSLMRGYKLYIYLNWMTFGVGTLVDVYGEGLYGMEEVSLADGPMSAVVVEREEALR